MSVRRKWFITAALILVFFTANADAAVTTAASPTATAGRGTPNYNRKDWPSSEEEVDRKKKGIVA